MQPERLILTPWNPAEAVDVAIAAKMAGVEPMTMRRWCARLGLGRQIGARWKVSRLALGMYLDGDREALARYHAGVLTGAEVAFWWTRLWAPNKVQIAAIKRANEQREQSEQALF